MTSLPESKPRKRCDRRTSNWPIAPSSLKLSLSHALRNWPSLTNSFAMRWTNAKPCVASYFDAQEEERRRIARELHDQMGQNLTALNVGLKSLLDRQSRSGLDSRVQRLQELATQTARDLHRVAVELRPAALDDLGLVKAIRALIETWSTRYGIDVDFEAGQYQPAGISSEIETILYRIIQEALNNVAKHSGATRVALVLRRTADHVHAIIEDDGRGSTLAWRPNREMVAAAWGCSEFRNVSVWSAATSRSNPLLSAVPHCLSAFQFPKHMKKKKKQSEAKIRVLLVDDHAGMREALRTFINSEPDLAVVAEAASGHSALDVFRTHNAGRSLDGRLDAWKEWNRGHPRTQTTSACGESHRL